MEQVIYTLDQDRSLELGFKAVVKLEKEFGPKFWVMARKHGEFSIEQVASVMAEAMRKETADITTDRVIDLIDKFSDTKEAFEKFSELICAIFGKKEVAEEQPVTQTTLN